MGDPVDTVSEPKASQPSAERSARLSLQPLCVLIFAMLLLGVILRVHAFGFPDSFMFDEHHFVENARNYINHQPDWNDHPPLGKLFIALSIQGFGDNPIGWRVPALVFGFITILCGGFAAARLFQSRAAGWMAAASCHTQGAGHDFIAGTCQTALER